jgi:hypothetical protein
MGAMEFEVTENGQRARLADARWVRVKRMSDPGTGVRTITICDTVDDSLNPSLKCDKYHYLESLPVDLGAFGSFKEGFLSGQLPNCVLSCRELVIVAWNNRSLGRWLC